MKIAAGSLCLGGGSGFYWTLDVAGRAEDCRCLQPRVPGKFFDGRFEPGRLDNNTTKKWTRADCCDTKVLSM